MALKLACGEVVLALQRTYLNIKNYYLALLKALKALYSSLRLISNFKRRYRKRDEDSIPIKDEEYPKLYQNVGFIPKTQESIEL